MTYDLGIVYTALSLYVDIFQFIQQTNLNVSLLQFIKLNIVL